MVDISGSVSQPYEYVGREGYYREEELGLYLLGQRWYDSEVGRFISRDPIEKANSYIYGKNNPIQFIDPDGKQAESLVCSTISLPYWMAAPAGAVLIEVVIVGGIIYFIYEICHRFEICPLQSEGPDRKGLHGLLCWWHGRDCIYLCPSGVKITTTVSCWPCNEAPHCPPDIPHYFNN